MTVVRCYSDLKLLETFDDRFEYLKIGGSVGFETFGFDRHINQRFYTSKEWHDARSYVIYRDNGCDLGVEGYEIGVSPLVHHMNPMGIEDVIRGEAWIIDPEFLITTTHHTHNAIHYGGESKMPAVVAQRQPNDTQLWQRR